MIGLQNMTTLYISNVQTLSKVVKVSPTLSNFDTKRLLIHYYLFLTNAGFFGANVDTAINQNQKYFIDARREIAA